VSSASGPGQGPSSPAVSPTSRSQVDLSVAASATSTTGLEWDIQVAVSGLATDQTATLTIRADHPGVNLQLDPACDPVGAGEAVCEVHGPTTLHMVVLPDPSTRTTLTLAVAPGANLEETNADNNVTRVTLAR
jgi:hypothetical protein